MQMREAEKKRSKRSWRAFEQSRCNCWSVLCCVHGPGWRTGRGPSGAGSWDRALVWRFQLRIHNNTELAVSFCSPSNTPRVLGFSSPLTFVASKLFSILTWPFFKDFKHLRAWGGRRLRNQLSTVCFLFSFTFTTARNVKSLGSCGWIATVFLHTRGSASQPLSCFTAQRENGFSVKVDQECCFTSF